jgi:hypothetical protein
MNRSYSKIRHIQESNMKLETKRLLMEQTKVDKINLPDGSYIGDGSGYEYQIKSPQGQDTGYTVKAKVGIRGMVEKDPVTITSGVPTSKTWGQGGEYTFKDVGYKPGPAPTPIQKLDDVYNDFLKKGYEDVTTWFFSPEGVVYIPDGQYLGKGSGYYLVVQTNDGKDTGYVFLTETIGGAERKQTFMVKQNGGAIGVGGIKLSKILLNNKILSNSGLSTKK